MTVGAILLKSSRPTNHSYSSSVISSNAAFTVEELDAIECIERTNNQIIVHNGCQSLFYLRVLQGE